MNATRSSFPVTPTEVVPTELPSPTGGAPDLPEVSDGSMELVESIIRSAQRASGSFSNLPN